MWFIVYTTCILIANSCCLYFVYLRLLCYTFANFYRVTTWLKTLKHDYNHYLYHVLFIHIVTLYIIKLCNCSPDYMCICIILATFALAIWFKLIVLSIFCRIRPILLFTHNLVLFCCFQCQHHDVQGDNIPWLRRGRLRSRVRKCLCCFDHRLWRKRQRFCLPSGRPRVSSKKTNKQNKT